MDSSGETGGCESQGSQGSCECEESSCCPACGGGCGGDPVECGAQLWTRSFFEAMKQVQVEILKAKIQKAWGPKFDKAADAVLEAMGARWQSMLSEAKAKAQLRERLQSLWQEK